MIFRQNQNLTNGLTPEPNEPSKLENNGILKTIEKSSVLLIIQMVWDEEL